MKDNSSTLKKFFQESIVFNNAITDLPWSNTADYLVHLNWEGIKSAGYNTLGQVPPNVKNVYSNLNSPNFFWYSSPQMRRRVEPVDPRFFFKIDNYFFPKIFNSNDFFSYRRKIRQRQDIYFLDFSSLAKELLDKNNWPFITQFHTKFMHLPYSSFQNNQISAGLKSFLTHEQYMHLNWSLKNVDTQGDRLPFYLLSVGMNNPQILNLVKKVSGNNQYLTNSGFGLIMSDKINTRWKKSKYYLIDQSVINALYDFRLHMLDKRINIVLDLLKNSDFRDNTVVIVSGDHGEAMGEHGVFSHASQNYEEMIKFPLAISYPNGPTMIIKKQFFQGTLAQIITDLTEGNLNKENIINYFSNLKEDETVYSINCENTLRTIRKKNKWKLIVNSQKNSKELYNLENDPGELVNLSEDEPEITLELFAELLKQTTFKNNLRMDSPCFKSDYE